MPPIFKTIFVTLLVKWTWKKKLNHSDMKALATIHKMWLLSFKGNPTLGRKSIKKFIYQGPVVQSVVSLTSSLRVILLTVLAVSIYNILIFFAEKM